MASYADGDNLTLFRDDWINQIIAAAAAKTFATAQQQPSKPIAESIGYFDSTLSWAPATDESHGVYTNVYDFKDRINTCKLHYSDKEVRELISVCLRGDALK